MVYIWIPSGAVTVKRWTHLSHILATESLAHVSPGSEVALATWFLRKGLVPRSDGTYREML